ncbi:hypothetical protein GQS52_11385 [Streptomyces sp. SCUT-3]|uniref:hypothetical protein n=1 Tax=unclassified Streptomyces TaxID=2593676 RepID=UPI0015F7B69E|nr:MULTISPECIES: hypothetical protein [unclassified Streptomyces]MCZ2523847.1 hypothetical protein [Streptomyces sp. HB2AG]QMV22296.1 hypothetical protein GQS52_11385 [Streptomyces sp. SCUT-3]
MEIQKKNPNEWLISKLALFFGITCLLGAAGVAGIIFFATRGGLDFSTAVLLGSWPIASVLAALGWRRRKISLSFVALLVVLAGRLAAGLFDQ